MANDDIPANPAVASTTIPGDHYHTLGRTTLWMFVLARIQPAVVLLILSVGLFVVSQQAFPASGTFAGVGYYALLGSGICLLLFILVFAILVLLGWLVYKNYTFALAEDSLKIRRGIMSKEEIAIPYRQIQDVDIERDFSFQMLGLSKIVILTAGHEDEKSADDDESEGVLPAIDKDLASWLQGELLKRADVQKVSETK
jgi:uncharacterized membrane protein YdbT with pleckstrin-like domain